MRLITLLYLVFSVSLLQAQNFVINNVTLFDGEQIQENVSVRVIDGKISEVGKNITTDDAQIEGAGKFLMPAMTNCHVHAWSAASLAQAAKAGVMNLLDMHGVEQFQPMMQQLNDSTNFARYFFAGAAATAPEGHGTQFGFPTPTLTTVDEAKAFVDGRKKAGAHYLKIIVEPWKPTLSNEVVKALIDEANEHKMLSVVHVSKVEDAVNVLSNGAGGLVHIWRDAAMDEPQLRELSANHQFFVVPTLLTTTLGFERTRKNNPEKEVITDEQLLAEVKKIYDAGIPLLAGTDPPNFNINFGTDLFKELVLLSKAGIPNLTVLKSATSLPAKHFDLGMTGSIKPGYTADMILLNANPLIDIQNISRQEMIWKNGKLVDRE